MTAWKNIFSNKITVEQPAAWVWLVITSDYYHAVWGHGTPSSPLHQQGPIRWSLSKVRPEWDNTGVVMDVVPNQRLVYTLHNPFTMLPLAPENHSRITIGITQVIKKVHIQVDVEDASGNPTVQDHLIRTWKKTLAGLKKTINDVYLKGQYDLSQAKGNPQV
jgi:uncharacterized protein YndB with AHSA1/START domain